jgi:hypothetical protein
VLFDIGGCLWEADNRCLKISSFLKYVEGMRLTECFGKMGKKWVEIEMI